MSSKRFILSIFAKIMNIYNSQKYPLLATSGIQNRRCGLQREFTLAAVGYTRNLKKFEELPNMKKIKILVSSKYGPDTE